MRVEWTLILWAKYGIFTFAFVGRFYATIRWDFPHSLGPDMKAKEPTYKFKMYCNHGNRELHKTIDASPDLLRSR